MRFLIVGFGSIGRRHFRNLRLLGFDDFIFFRSGKSTIEDDEIAHYPVYHDYQEALNQHPTAVIISSPSAFHVEQTIMALKQNVHVFLEKPVSDNMAGLELLKAAANESKGKVLVGFQFRYHPSIIQMKSWIEAGKIGKVTSARIFWGEYLPDWHPWEDYRNGYAARKDLGGGVVNTLCHPIDYCRYLLGEISETSSFCSNAGLELEVEDTALILFKMKSRALVSLEVNYLQRPPIHQISITGTHGSITWDQKEGYASLHRPDLEQLVSPIPENHERNDLFIDQMKHFIDYINKDISAKCSLNDGIEAVIIAEKIKS